MFTAFRKLSRLERVLVAICSLMFAVAMFSTTLAFLRTSSNENTFDPFGEYPIQTVVGAERNVDGFPVISLSEDRGVQVVGRKCIDHDEPVSVQGEGFFVFKSPGGISVPYFSGTGSLLPGCTHFVEDVEADCPAGTTVGTADTPGTCREAFFNVFSQSEELLSHIQSFHEGGINPRLEIQGFETPVDGGVTQVWETEQFVVVP